MTPRLRVDDLTVRFGDNLAVDAVSFDVDRGEVLGLVGESGSGKSTIARAVLGFQRYSGGVVALDGESLDPRRRTVEQRRAVQMVFQDPYGSLNPRRTIRSVLAELLRIHGLASGRTGIAARSAELLELVRLPASALDSYPGEFSGGQRQRLAIARALAVEPLVLVADEPTSALDVSVQAAVLDLLDSLRSELGLTVLLITHDLGVVARLCDRVAVLHAGRIVETGTRDRFFAGPTTDYARELLAAAPRLPGRTP